MQKQQELVEALNQLNTKGLQSFSDEELKKLEASLSLKLAEVQWILRGRAHHRTHFAPKSTKAE